MKQGKSIVRKPVVDRLAFILPWGCDPFSNQEELLVPIRKRIAKLIDTGTCERAYPIGGRYRENFRIKLAGGSAAFIQIGALQKKIQKGGIRILVNPARFGPGDAKQLNNVMRSILGREYGELMKRPLVNVIDFAVDIVGPRLDDLLVDYSNAHRRTTFGKRVNRQGRIEGYNYGSVTSDYMAVVYGKSTERIHAAVLELVKHGLGDEGLKSNVVKQLKRLKNGPDIVRVEVRGKKLRGLPLAKLASLRNRFVRFRFAELQKDGAKLPPFLEKAFVALCRENGVPAALEACKGSEHARPIRAYWRTHQAEWWQPDDLWQQACEAVKTLSLFPKEAFERND